MDLKEILITWGGWLLAVILGIIEISNYLRDRAIIKVKIEPHYSRILPDGDDGLVSLDVVAINVGRRPITLSRAGLLMPRNRKQKYLGCIDCDPANPGLTEGKSHIYNLAADKLEQEYDLPVDKYVACVIDETEKWYWSHNWLLRLIKLGRIK